MHNIMIVGNNHLYNFRNHPIFSGCDVLQPLTQALQECLDINYFCHTRIDSEKNFSFLGGINSIAEIYLEQAFYNLGMHSFSGSNDLPLIVHDRLVTNPKLEPLYQVFQDNNIYHILTIVEQSKHNVDYYHFGLRQRTEYANLLYLKHMDLLTHAITFFKQLVKENSHLQNAYNYKAKLSDHCFTTPITNFLTTTESEKHQRFKIKTPIKQDSTRTKLNSLTIREQQVLHCLSKGITHAYAARMLGISERTVKAHVNNIKDKLGCSSLFQLGFWFSENLK